MKRIKYFISKIKKYIQNKKFDKLIKESDPFIYK